MSALELVEFKPCCTGSDEFHQGFIQVPRADGTTATVPLIGGGSYPNGQIPLSALKPIAGSGYLEEHAAAAWNAMAVHILKETGVHIAPAGPDSSYRPYARQVYWRNYWCGQGNCGNAAVPGTSNHGWGLAVDVVSYAIPYVQKYGAPFGWQKQWSDASWEPWHFKYAPGHYSGPDPGPSYSGSGSVDHFPSLQKGDNGEAVRRMQRRLRKWNDGLKKPEVDGGFGEATADALKQFQAVHGLVQDGRCGPKSWRQLRKRDKLLQDERSHVNRIRWYKQGGVSDAQRDNVRALRDWCAKRAKSIRDVAEHEGWSGQDRKFRFETLKGAAGDQF